MSFSFYCANCKRPCSSDSDKYYYCKYCNKHYRYFKEFGSQEITEDAARMGRRIEKEKTAAVQRIPEEFPELIEDILCLLDGMSYADAEKVLTETLTRIKCAARFVNNK